MFFEIEAVPRWILDFLKLKKLKAFLEIEALPRWILDF